MAFLKYLCDNFDIDGIYHDEFTYTRKFVTYNMWDKVSVELDKIMMLSVKSVLCLCSNWISTGM